MARKNINRKNESSNDNNLRLEWLATLCFVMEPPAAPMHREDALARLRQIAFRRAQLHVEVTELQEEERQLRSFAARGRNPRGKGGRADALYCLGCRCDERGKGRGAHLWYPPCVRQDPPKRQRRLLDARAADAEARVSAAVAEEEEA